MKIEENPYKIICEYAENLFPHVGGELFEILSLVPPSIIIDDIDYMGEKIRSNINVLFLTPSGGAKSQCAKLFSELTYNTISGKSYTAAGLRRVIRETPFFTLIIEDYATMSLIPELNKILEGIMGEEKTLDHHTNNGDTRENVNGAVLLCGVPSDLSNKVTGGMIFRTVCVIKTHNSSEHSEIGLHIAENLFKKSDMSDTREQIKDYYRRLGQIQTGNDPDNEPVFSFDISDKINKKIYDEWESLSTQFRKNAPYNYFRELYDGYRILISHGFLNYFKREIKDNVLKVTEEDCKVALKILKKTMKIKYELLMSEKLAKGINSIKSLEKIYNDKKIPALVKDLIPSHIKNKLN